MFESFSEEYDLFLGVIFSLLCILFVLVPPLNETPIRTAFGLPFVLFLPGYSLIAALFPSRDNLEWIERFALSFGLSIAIVPLLGFVLNYTPFGIRLISILIILSTFTISFSLIAWARRLKLPADQRFRFPFENLLTFKRFLKGTVWDKILSVILVTSIIFLSINLIYGIAKPKTDEGFTEFYLLNQNGTAYNYPNELNVGDDGKVIIGIVNQEYKNATYRLEVNFNGPLIYEENVFLIESEKWEIYLTFKATEKGENQKLEFLLYKEQQIEAYRTLHIWINIK